MFDFLVHVSHVVQEVSFCAVPASGRDKNPRLRGVTEQVGTWAGCVSKTLSASREVGPRGLWVFQGTALAAATDRLKVERRVLSSQSEKHVAGPARPGEQPQRTASQGKRTEHRTSAAHTCKYSQGFTLFSPQPGVRLQCRVTGTKHNPTTHTDGPRAAHEIVSLRTCAARSAKTLCLFRTLAEEGEARAERPGSNLSDFVFVELPRPKHSPGDLDEPRPGTEWRSGVGPDRGSEHGGGGCFPACLPQLKMFASMITAAAKGCEGSWAHRQFMLV